MRLYWDMMWLALYICRTQTCWSLWWDEIILGYDVTGFIHMQNPNMLITMVGWDYTGIWCDWLYTYAEPKHADHYGGMRLYWDMMWLALYICRTQTCWSLWWDEIILGYDVTGFVHIQNPNMLITMVGWDYTGIWCDWLCTYAEPKHADHYGGMRLYWDMMWLALYICRTQTCWSLWWDEIILGYEVTGFVHIQNPNMLITMVGWDYTGIWSDWLCTYTEPKHADHYGGMRLYWDMKWLALYIYRTQTCWSLWWDEIILGYEVTGFVHIQNPNMLITMVGWDYTGIWCDWLCTYAEPKHADHYGGMRLYWDMKWLALYIYRTQTCWSLWWDEIILGYEVTGFVHIQNPNMLITMVGWD